MLDDDVEEEEGEGLYSTTVKASMKLLHSGQIDMAAIAAAEGEDHGNLCMWIILEQF